MVLWFFIELWPSVNGEQQIVAASHQPAKFNRAPVQVETTIHAPQLENSDSLATIVPAQPSSLHGSNGLARGFGGGTALGAPRTIQDWEIEDFVLLATVDGSLMARDRKTGTRRWELVVDTPVVQTIYHRANETNKDSIDDDDFVWIVEPIEEGALFRYHPDLGLEVISRSSFFGAYSTNALGFFAGINRTNIYIEDRHDDEEAG